MPRLHRPRRLGRRPAVVLIVAVVLATMSGCAADDWSSTRPAPRPIGELRPGFLPTASPSPEATVSPVSGSWDDVRPGAGYRVVLLSSGDDRPSRTLRRAVLQWAEASGVELRTVPVGHDPVPAIVRAVKLEPDLIISTGNRLVDPLALVTASHLDQEFLVVGAEVAEPTANVTAVDWTGASFRGEGLGTSSTYDASSFTDARCASAVRAGVAAVLHDLTGVVLWID